MSQNDGHREMNSLNLHKFAILVYHLGWLAGQQKKNNTVTNWFNILFCVLLLGCHSFTTLQYRAHPIAHTHNLRLKRKIHHWVVILHIIMQKKEKKTISQTILLCNNSHTQIKVVVLLSFFQFVCSALVVFAFKFELKRSSRPEPASFASRFALFYPEQQTKNLINANNVRSQFNQSTLEATDTISNNSTDYWLLFYMETSMIYKQNLNELRFSFCIYTILVYDSIVKSFQFKWNFSNKIKLLTKKKLTLWT